MNKEWFAEERGIEPETLDAFGVKFDGDTVIFPYGSTGEKKRWVDETGKRHFSFTKGGKPGLFNAKDGMRDTVFIVEGETDTMRLWQELRAVGIEHGVVGIAGINAWQDDFAGIPADKVFVILDNDEDYAVRAQVDTVWMQMKKALGLRAKRIKLPAEVKDICKFFETYDLSGLRALAKASVSRFKRLDFTVEPPPIQWLAEGLLARSDVTTCIGESNVGKSWLSMDLAVAVVEGRGSWLGSPVFEQGPVIYVDEENPVDVVYERLQLLGLTDSGQDRLHYFHDLGLRLDLNHEDLLEEAMDVKPKLIVIDSLSRVHACDEDSNSQMGRLFHENIKPLARETGAAVMVLHHMTKAPLKGNASSNNRSRGATAIMTSSDGGLDVRAQQEGFLSVYPFKTRRKRKDGAIDVQIQAHANGVRVVRATPPF